MLQTLRARILLVVSGVVFLTILAITFFAQRGLEEAISDAADHHARDLMNTVLLNVETEYESLVFHKAATLTRRKSELKNILSLAFAHVDEYHQKQLSGHLSERTARQTVIEAIKDLRYDDGVGYIWINDLGQPIPRMIMHPTHPELDGELLDDSSYNTAAGGDKNLFTACVDVSLAAGEGYVDYLWPKPGPQGLSSQQPKLSYVRLFFPWGWVLGTGVYIDDIEEETDKRLQAIIEELNDALARIRIAETGYMTIFNGSGEMLIHPSRSGTRLLGRINPDTGNPLSGDMMKAAEQPDKPFDYLWDRPEHKGEFRFKKRAYISYFPPLDWYILSTMYLAEIEQPIKTLRARTIHLSVFSLIAGLFFAFILSKSLTKPLNRLTSAAEGIERTGVALARIPVSGTRETKELGLVLNQMVRAIRRVEDDLREKNRELEAFTYSVSHDLRTPLTPIIAYAQILRDLYQEKLDEQAIDILDEIEAQGEKMLEMMENLLTLAKGEALECPTGAVDVDRVVQRVLAALEGSIKGSGVRITTSFLPTIHVPESFLFQVFDNLIGNALRYAGNRDPRIEIGGERREDQVCFFVRDHGRGIPAAERERIFEPFFRGEAGNGLSGTGVGLSTVEKIARSYGGSARVEQTPGGGSTFWVVMSDIPWSGE